ncbi:MAG TPA: aldehyde ferredoxin oxidoreductase N-terminal domain-containing protein [Thermodesulfobacteriota bacterium]|nr:aldehyde ferredoxin oxidoreductase N-terminal domain-containing protein [Thermodesulfobacteriota bacterium]
MKIWTGKRLFVDLGIHRAWTEEIPEEDLEKYIGGRGLNGKFFLDYMISRVAPSSHEDPIVFGVGPLAGTFAPCSGWTSISAFSPLSRYKRYAHTSLPGHWGPQLKFAGFDQLIVKGKAEKPVYLSIEGEKVSIEEAKHLWGKDTVETTVAIQEDKKDRDIEVLCIGPAGENLVYFANVTNRFSWTGDHVSLGYLFGSKNLKAIAVHGNSPVSLNDPDRFLQICLSLREQIQRDPCGMRLKEEGPFLVLKQNGIRFGVRNYSEASQPDTAERWKAAYFTNHFYGKEGCFSCPIHCGRISEVNGNYFGGVHFESAWSLGPHIGIEDWEKTMLLHRISQLQGFDPCSMGSLIAWAMDCYEKGILSAQELGLITCQWGDEKAALQLIEWIAEKKEAGEVLCQGSFLAAKSLGKGSEQVPHFWGMDLPARDPRSSMEYALSRALFPMEWDYLQSLTNPVPVATSSTNPQMHQTSGMLKRTLDLEKRRVLADLNSLCPLVVARFPLLSDSDVEELFSAMTGKESDGRTMMEAVQRTLWVEKLLCRQFTPEELEVDPLPLRFFNDPMEKTLVGKEIADYEILKEFGSL